MSVNERKFTVLRTIVSRKQQIAVLRPPQTTENSPLQTLLY